MRIVNTPYFIATRLEAFAHRGAGDQLFSRDIGDIVALIDGRSETVDEMRASDPDVRSFVATAFAALLAHRAFLDAQPAHFPGDEASQRRTSLLLTRMRAIAEHELGRDTRDA